MFFTIISIILLLFIFPLAIKIPFIIFSSIFIIGFSFEIFNFVVFVSVTFYWGLRNLISVILFSTRRFVINDIGFTYCGWWPKTIYWRDVKKIETDKCISLDVYDMVFYFKNGKEKRLNLYDLPDYTIKKIYRDCSIRLQRSRESLFLDHNIIE